jgi:hypothetical protein
MGGNRGEIGAKTGVGRAFELWVSARKKRGICATGAWHLGVAGAWHLMSIVCPSACCMCRVAAAKGMGTGGPERRVAVLSRRIWSSDCYTGTSRNGSDDREDSANECVEPVIRGWVGKGVKSGRRSAWDELLNCGFRRGKKRGICAAGAWHLMRWEPAVGLSRLNPLPKNWAVNKSLAKGPAKANAMPGVHHEKKPSPASRSTALDMLCNVTASRTIKPRSAINGRP